MFDVTDLRATIVPKSDQLNAEQLLGGATTVIVSEVRTTDSAEQPVTIHYEGDDGRPYKPCKTMRKVLILAWGPDGRAWVGKSMTLYNDTAVKFGGERVGGVRISHMSGIKRTIEVSLTAPKGKKALHTIKVLQGTPSSRDLAVDAAKQLAVDVKRGDAAGAAVAAGSWDQAWRNEVWTHLDDDTAQALEAHWAVAA